MRRERNEHEKVQSPRGKKRKKQEGPRASRCMPGTRYMGGRRKKRKKEAGAH